MPHCYRTPDELSKSAVLQGCITVAEWMSCLHVGLGDQTFVAWTPFVSYSIA